MNHAATIISSYVTKNALPQSELPSFISSIYRALQQLSTGETSSAKAEPTAPLSPAVPIKKSVTDEHIICLEDGKKFKSLKRHLKSAFGMTPEDYRQKWGLARDYPMVAPSYSATRSQLAKTIGLGANRKGVKAVDAATSKRKTKAQGGVKLKKAA